MDSTQITSNIRQASRVQRNLSPADQAHYAETFAPHVKGTANQDVYRLKSEETAPYLHQIGEWIQRLLDELRAAYGEQVTYRMVGRVFSEPSRQSDNAAAALPGTEISAGSLQSPDDLEVPIARRATMPIGIHYERDRDVCIRESLSTDRAGAVRAQCH